MVSKGIPKRCWSLTTLRRLEEVALPKLDRCLQNDRLLIHVCEVLLNSHRHLVGSAEVIPNDGSLQIFFVRWWLQPERTTYKLHNTRFTFKFLLHIVISQCFSWRCIFPSKLKCAAAALKSRTRQQSWTAVASYGRCKAVSQAKLKCSFIKDAKGCTPSSISFQFSMFYLFCKYPIISVGHRQSVRHSPLICQRPFFYFLAWNVFPNVTSEASFMLLLL